MISERGHPFYIITQDVYPLIAGWAKRHAFALPPKAFFRNLLNRLSRSVLGALMNRYGNDTAVEVLGFDKLQDSIRAGLTKKNPPRPWVSLDELYFSDADYHIGVNRAVEFEPSVNGWVKPAKIVARYGYPPLPEQVAAIAKLLKQGGVTEITVLDDGCWKGETLSEVVSLFEYHGIHVRIHVGIKIIQKNTSPITERVEALAFEFEAPIDWVCERDFLPGVSLAGRSVIMPKGKGGDVGIPYLTIPDKPYHGNAEWASTSEGEIGQTEARELSRACLHLDIELFDAIGHCSGRPVLWRDIDRKPFGIESDDGSRYTDVVQENLLGSLLRI